MERKVERLLIRLPPVRWTPSALRKVVDVLDLKDAGLIVETDRYVFASIEEFLDSAEEYSEVFIGQRSDPQIGITFDSEAVRICAPAATNEAVGIATRVREALPRPLCRHVEFSLGTAMAAGLLFLGSMGLVPIILGGVTRYTVAVGLGGVLTMGCAGDLFWRGRRGRLLVEREVGEVKSVNWRGALWDVMKIVLGAVLGALLTWRFRGK